MLIGLLPFPSNSKIIAESWLDEYKNMFYALRPVARRIPLDHTYDEMQELRRERQCHPFEWYRVFTDLYLKISFFFLMSPF